MTRVLCICGRKLNLQGRTCCRMCWIGYGTHSYRCRKNNPNFGGSRGN